MSAPTPDSVRPVPEAQPTRRRLLLAATAAGAGLAGVGAAWWRMQGTQAPAPTPPVEGFWANQFDTPDGGKLALQSFQGRPLLINFWATWCAPCVEELPLINDFFVKNRSNGWQVIGLAVDKLAPVQGFLQKMPLAFPVGMAGLGGAELSRGLGNLVGGLPFSVVFGRDGMVLQRKMGRLTPADLDSWLRLK